MDTKTNSTVRIAIVYHFVPKHGNDSYFSHEHALVDNQTDEIVAYMKKLFERKEYIVECVVVEPGNLTSLQHISADLVYNLVDSKAMEVETAKELERLHLPFTGTGSLGIARSNDKVKTKELFLKNTLPTAPFTIIRPRDRIVDSLVPSDFPVIVKPAHEHCSIGITNQSIATSYETFVEIVQRLRKNHNQTLLAEQFIPGKELQVTVYEKDGMLHALPVAEIAFKHVKNEWNIYGFDEKWAKEKEIYKSCNFIAPPKDVPDDIDKAIKNDSIRAYRAFGMKDYARFDLRYNPENKRWYFLEGNANAGFDPDPRDAMTVSVAAAGLTLDDFILIIVNNALSRYRT